MKRFVPGFLLLLAGCAAFGRGIEALPPDAVAQGYRLVSRPAPLPRGRVTADCGPEALSAVLRFWGLPVNVDEITARIYRQDLKGTLSTALPPMAREKGLEAELVTGSVGRLRDAVDRDCPPIIMVRIRGELYHFFVVTGYNDRLSEIVCEEYDGGRRLLSYRLLEESWGPAGYYCLELRKADADSDARTGMDFEAKGDARRALDYYRRALERNPDHVDALIGMGNCLHVTGDRAGARKAYEKALGLAPEDPKLNNNLADLYIALGEKLAEAERMAEKVVATFTKRREELLKEVVLAREPRRSSMKRELADLELDLAGAFGTFGQARAANGRHDLAVAAFQASLNLIPLDQFDWRARRFLEIGRSYEKLGMGHEARKQYTLGLEAAKDPELRDQIEKLLRSP